jgi:hypothetical protein
MSPAATANPAILAESSQAEGPAPSLFDSSQLAPGGPGVRTLEDVVLSVWEELAAKGRAECPVCGGSLGRGGGCSGCGAELS